MNETVSRNERNTWRLYVEGRWNATENSRERHEWRERNSFVTAIVEKSRRRRMARGKDDRATLDTIAEELGVSKGSVSKALNNRPGVSEALRARVWRAAAESGYASPDGSGPARRSSIAVVFDTLANLYSLAMLDGMVAEAQRLGVDVVPEVLSPLSTGPADAPTEQRILDLHARGHDGLIVVTTTIPPSLIALCRDLGLPLVSVDSPNSLDADVVSVGSNNWMGGMQATRHL